MTEQRFHELGRKILGGELGSGQGLDPAEQRELLDEFCLLQSFIRDELEPTLERLRVAIEPKAKSVRWASGIPPAEKCRHEWRSNVFANGPEELMCRICGAKR